MSSAATRRTASWNKSLRIKTSDREQTLFVLLETREKVHKHQGSKVLITQQANRSGVRAAITQAISVVEPKARRKSTQRVWLCGRRLSSTSSRLTSDYRAHREVIVGLDSETAVFISELQS